MPVQFALVGVQLPGENTTVIFPAAGTEENAPGFVPESKPVNDTDSVAPDIYVALIVPVVLFPWNTLPEAGLAEIVKFSGACTVNIKVTGAVGACPEMDEVPLKTIGYVPGVVAPVALKIIVLVQLEGDGEHAVGEEFTDTPAGAPLDMMLTNSFTPELKVTVRMLCTV